MFIPIICMYVCGLPETYRFVKEKYGTKIPNSVYEERNGSFSSDEYFDKLVEKELLFGKKN